jgi:hypothetical protein
MSIINKGTAFSNGEQLTADKLNDLVDLATFDQSATDSASTTVNTSGQIVVADSGVSTAKIADDAVTTAKILDANVTKAKIEDVADYKVLGNVSGTAAAPAEVSVLDEDDMTSDSATALATQQSIKAYVDSSAQTFVPASYAGGESVTLPNGLIMKFGTVTAGITGTLVSFASAFPTAAIWASACPNSSDNLTQSTGYSGKASVDSLSTSGVNVSCNGSAYWQAIGY